MQTLLQLARGHIYNCMQTLLHFARGHIYNCMQTLLQLARGHIYSCMQTLLQLARGRSHTIRYSEPFAKLSDSTELGGIVEPDAKVDITRGAA